MLSSEFIWDGQKVRMWLPDADEWISRQIIHGTFYEEGVLRFLQKYLDKNSVVIDVGASIGNHAVFFGLFCKKVYAFEPLKEAFDLMVRNVVENSLPNIDVKNQAVAARAGRLTLRRVFEKNIGMAYWWYAEEDFPKRLDHPILIPYVGEATAEAVTLNEAIEDNVDLVKIDVEGMEMEVLSGARNLIDRCRPMLVVEVMPSRTDSEFLKWCRDNGYACSILKKNSTVYFAERAV